MYFLHIILLVKAIRAMDIEITGELAFDLKISNLDLKQVARSPGQSGLQPGQPGQQAGRHGQQPGARDRAMRSNMTAAPFLECAYQYPEQEQIDAMLSNMMNQLTKVFVRAHDFMKRSNHRRVLGTRYRVVQKKDTSFFEQIYNNMTQEYKHFYNDTTSRVARSDRDPCTHQEEIKHLWRELLDAASHSLRRASLLCVEEYLKHESIPEPRLKKNLEKFLFHEMEKIRSNQLTILCDTFQLCYHELM